MRYRVELSFYWNATDLCWYHHFALAIEFIFYNVIVEDGMLAHF